MVVDERDPQGRTTRFSDSDPDVDVLYGSFAEAGVQPLWRLDGLMGAQPPIAAVPWRWTASSYRPLAERAGELVPVPVHSGDVLAVPAWCPWQMSAASLTDVFSVSDAPLLEACGLSGPPPPQ